MKTADIDNLYDHANLVKVARDAELWACIMYLYNNGFEDAARALKQKADDADKDKK